MSNLAVISGATGGIGRVVTERLWQAGYSVLALGKTPTKCLELQDWFIEHPRAGQDEFVTAMDLTQPYEDQHLRQVLELYADHVALLAVCHGAPPCVKPTVSLTDADMARVWETDVHATLRLCQAVGRSMVAQRHGSIVLLSSVHALQTYPGRTAYCVAKAGVVALAKALAVEWGPDNVRVNSLCPWQVAGRRTQHFLDAAAAHGSDLQALYAARVPLGRLVSPEDVASAVLWLTENQSITGQALTLDAGLTASGWYKPHAERA